MKILDILNSPWAITPEKLVEIQDIYVARCRGEKADLEAIEARIGKPLNNHASGYAVTDGVAVLPIEGVIAKKMNLFTQISGGVSTQMFQEDLKAALNDPSAHSILLLVDSPGGQVDGTQQAADAVRSARGQKPIYALADGLMASGAYWIGSAADKVFIVSDTTNVGSIGVVAKHVDYSKSNERDGVTVTEITAGKYKRIASENAPLSPEGRASIQEQVDQVYSVFVDAVAKNRGVDMQTVLDKMANGRVFMGKKAVDAGLVDGVSSMAALVNQLNRISQGATASNSNVGVLPMEKLTIASIGASISTQAELDAAVEKLTATVTAKAKEDGVKSGATAERERIKAVETVAQGFPGHEELVTKLKFDGTTSGDQAATQILAAEKTLRGNKLKDIREDAPKAVGSSVPDPKKEGEQAKDDGAAKNGTDVHAQARKISDYVDEQGKKGRKVSYAEAAAIVAKQS